MLRMRLYLCTIKVFVVTHLNETLVRSSVLPSYMIILLKTLNIHKKSEKKKLYKSMSDENGAPGSILCINCSALSAGDQCGR